MGMSMGKSKSSSASTQQSQQNVWEGQAPYLLDLYKRASEMLPGLMPTEQETNAYRALAPAGAEALGGMLGPGTNPWLGQMASAGLGKLGETYTQQIMPAIRDAALGAGQMGGSRGQLLAAQAGKDWTGQASDFISQMYGGQYNADMQRRLMAAELVGQGYNPAMGTLERYAGILGRPTVLGSSSGMSMGKSSGWNLGFGK